MSLPTTTPNFLLLHLRHRVFTTPIRAGASSFSFLKLDAPALAPPASQHLRVYSSHRPRPTPTPTESTGSIFKPAPVDLSSRINGPPTTMPPELNLPDKADGEGLGYYFKLGKEYLSFYKRGLVSVYRNYTSATEIQRRIDDAGGEGKLRKLIESKRITRGEYLLLNRSRHDAKRIPIFGLMVLVCGELTPFVVVVFSAVVPFSCRIPKQLLSDRRKLEHRRHSLPQLPLLPPSPDHHVDFPHLPHSHLLYLSSSLGIHSPLWTHLARFFPSAISNLLLPPNAWLRRGLGKRMEYLRMDDRLIDLWGGVNAMSDMEAEYAAVERGIDTLGRSNAEIRRDLNKWLDVRREAEKEGVDVTLMWHFAM